MCLRFGLDGWMDGCGAACMVMVHCGRIACRYGYIIVYGNKRIERHNLSVWFGDDKKIIIQSPSLDFAEEIKSRNREPSIPHRGRAGPDFLLLCES